MSKIIEIIKAFWAGVKSSFINDQITDSVTQLGPEKPAAPVAEAPAEKKPKKPKVKKEK